MGYACPVCDDPQADARHLANHLAFTAMLGREDHEAWLDEHTPGWEDEGEHELADRVASQADEADYPQVFEDTTGRMSSEIDAEDDHERSGALFDDERGHSHRGEHGHDHGHSHGYEQADVPRDPKTEEVLEEARDLTEEMLEGDDESEEQSDDSSETDDET